jgi:threonine/homoserine/homoserine lactone efflux protein
MEFPSYLTSVGLILLALLAGVLSPGPSFVMAARTAVAKSRDDGLVLSLGLGLGATLITALCLGGLHGVLIAVPWLYMALKLAGGLYLAYLAWNIWKGAPLTLDFGDLEIPSDKKLKRNLLASLRLGFITAASNPKTAVVYSSVFAALLPVHFPFIGSVLIVVGAFMMEFAWNAIVVLVLSSPAPRAAYMRSKTAIDRIAAGVMGLLAARLISTAHHAH